METGRGVLSQEQVSVIEQIKNSPYFYIRHLMDFVNAFEADGLNTNSSLNKNTFFKNSDEGRKVLSYISPLEENGIAISQPKATNKPILFRVTFYDTTNVKLHCHFTVSADGKIDKQDLPIFEKCEEKHPQIKEFLETIKPLLSESSNQNRLK